MSEEQPIVNSFEEEIEMPQNHMTLAIIGAIIGTLGAGCLGLIIGGVAIYSANRVKFHFANKNVVEAQKSASTAKTLGILSIVLGVIGVIYLFFNWDEIQYYLNMP